MAMAPSNAAMRRVEPVGVVDVERQHRLTLLDVLALLGQAEDPGDG